MLVTTLGPQLYPLKVLHRHDGFISFAVKADDHFKPAFTIRADALDTFFPEFRERLIRDSFVSLNGAYRHANGGKSLKGFPQHRNDTLRYLCACYCDIDCYKHGLSFNDAFKAILDLYAEKTLPPASMVVDSGRGMWLLWLLHDESDPVKAHFGAWLDNPNDHYLLYAKVNRAIGQRLTYLGADSCATDGARYIRMPGSFRNDQETEIKWWIHGHGNSVYSYTIKELGKFFGIEAPKRLQEETAALAAPRKKCGNRSKGWKAAKQNALAAFCTVRDIRGGGFNDGCRNQAALVYAMLLRSNGVSLDDARRAIDRMGAQCKPPLSDCECWGAIKSGFKPSMKKVSYQRMADWFDVRPEEAEIVSQRIGKPFPAAGHFGSYAAATNLAGEEKRATKQSTRRREIRAIIENERAREPPSFRAMQGLLCNRGIQASHVTIRADYQALGLVTTATANIREIVRAENSQMPLIVAGGPSSEHLVGAC